MVFSLNPKFVSVFHIVFVAPLLILIGLGKFPDEYKKWLVVLGVIVGLYHLIRLIALMRAPEHMTVESGEGIEMEYPMNDVINGLNVHHIRMFDSSPGFEVPLINIKQGDVIVWSNVGEVQHTVTEKDDLFDSGYLKPGERFSVRFTEKGTFDYRSIPDEGWMIGRVIVN